MHTTHQVSQTTFGFSLRRRFGLVFSRNLEHLTDVCEELTGFFGNSLDLVYRNLLSNRVTYIRIADAKRESFSVHQLHDIQNRSVTPQNYRVINIRSFAVKCN